jgi:predicted alpha/beta-fold hydrolase
MARSDCAFYMRRFLRDMGTRMDAKRVRFGAGFPAADWRAMRTFAEFDDAFTAPLHGFAGAEDYWARCSAVRFLDGLRVPTLILNAQDDPFLAPECSPVAAATRSTRLTLELPRHGGHVGLVGGGAYPGEYSSERRVAEFLDAVVPE